MTTSSNLRALREREEARILREERARDRNAQRDMVRANRPVTYSSPTGRETRYQPFDDWAEIMRRQEDAEFHRLVEENITLNVDDIRVQRIHRPMTPGEMDALRYMPPRVLNHDYTVTTATVPPIDFQTIDRLHREQQTERINWPTVRMDYNGNIIETTISEDGTHTIERPYMANNTNAYPFPVRDEVGQGLVTGTPAQPRAVPQEHWPLPIRNPAAEVFLQEFAPQQAPWVDPNAAQARAQVAAQPTIESTVEAIKTEANEAEDPNSDEAKRKLIEKRLQEIRSTVGVQFGEVLMQSVNLFPTHVEATVGGIRKTIAIMDFKQILDGFIKSDTKIENMQMPFGTFLFGRANGEIQISCYYPARRATVKHIDGYDASPREYNIPIPNVIISHKLKQTGTEWTVLDSHYFCTDRKVTSLPEGEFIWNHDARKGIYIMPFTNFYPEGRMCFGNNSVPKRCTNNLNGLDYYYKIIEIAPFNNDLGVRSVRGVDHPRTWFKQMSDMNEFDYSKLNGYVPYAATATMNPVTPAPSTTAASAIGGTPATTVRRTRTVI